MKKIMVVFYMFLLSILLSSFALADAIVADIDPPDINSTYWAGSDQNPSLVGQLVNSNPTTEEAWLEALLGKVYNDPTVNYITKIDGSGDKQLTDFDPGVAWDYAIVKYGNYWIAYGDTGNDDLLTAGSFDFGVSHVTLFGGEPIPEPATMFLLGSGLIGLAGYGRKKFLKK